MVVATVPLVIHMVFNVGCCGRRHDRGWIVVVVAVVIAIMVVVGSSPWSLS